MIILAVAEKPRFEAGAVQGNSLVSTTQPDMKKACAEKDEQLDMSGYVSPSSDFSRIGSIDEDDIRNLARTAP
jgi:hypothetical protein